MGAGYSTKLCLDAAETLSEQGISGEVVDLRVLNPLDSNVIVDSVSKTGRLLAVDGGWRTCGLAGEIIARVAERLSPHSLKSTPTRLHYPIPLHPPAPRSSKPTTRPWPIS